MPFEAWSLRDFHLFQEASGRYWDELASAGSIGGVTDGAADVVAALDGAEESGEYRSQRAENAGLAEKAKWTIPTLDTAAT